MFTRWTIVATTILLLSAAATSLAAGAQSEPKQKGAEKGAPETSGTAEKRQIGTAADRLNRVEHPARNEENPGQSESLNPPLPAPLDASHN
jgi:hypothetical protein